MVKDLINGILNRPRDLASIPSPLCSVSRVKVTKSQEGKVRSFVERNVRGEIEVDFRINDCRPQAPVRGWLQPLCIPERVLLSCWSLFNRNAAHSHGSTGNRIGSLARSRPSCSTVYFSAKVEHVLFGPEKSGKQAARISAVYPFFLVLLCPFVWQETLTELEKTWVKKERESRLESFW